MTFVINWLLVNTDIYHAWFWVGKNWKAKRLLRATGNSVQKMKEEVRAKILPQKRKREQEKQKREEKREKEKQKRKKKNGEEEQKGEDKKVQGERKAEGKTPQSKKNVSQGGILTGARPDGENEYQASSCGGFWGGMMGKRRRQRAENGGKRASSSEESVAPTGDQNV